jgi:hypothetical protein
MSSIDDSNASSWSPTCEWEIAKIRRPPQRQRHSAKRRLLWARLSRRNPTTPLSITVEWRGGAEAWIRVSGRGSYRNYPGYATIADVVLDINNAH